MTAVSLPTFMFGPGWRAEASYGCIVLTIDAEATDDPLSEAIETLLPEWTRPGWTVRWLGEDTESNDVFAVVREH